jgi:hypothetical protein
MSNLTGPALSNPAKPLKSKIFFEGWRPVGDCEACLAPLISLGILLVVVALYRELYRAFCEVR